MEAPVNFKAMPFKKKIGYIWDYYKYPILGILFAIITIISTIYSQLTAKECLLKLIMVNGTVPIETAIFAEDFLESEGYDSNTQEVTATTIRLGLTEETYEQDYEAIQALFVRLTSETVDIMSASDEIFDQYASEGFFINLNDLFTKEELNLYQDLIVYTTHYETGELYPCGFDLSDNTWIKEHIRYNTNCQFGILFNAPNMERTKSFFTYLLNY